jgi:uncharacterized protein YgiM (DUF1202 family)
MFKLIVATLAAMYLIALAAGDAPETQEVARAADPEFDLSLSAFVGAAEASTGDIEKDPVGEVSMTDSQAIELALATGQQMRDERTGPVRLLGQREPAEVAAREAAEVEPLDLWQVTGTLVNLRSGPGTGNDIVAQLSIGTEAEVLDEGNGWYRIRTADGAVDGWIFGKYLAQAG